MADSLLSLVKKGKKSFSACSQPTMTVSAVSFRGALFPGNTDLHRDHLSVSGNMDQHRDRLSFVSCQGDETPRQMQLEGKV